MNNHAHISQIRPVPPGGIGPARGGLAHRIAAAAPLLLLLPMLGGCNGGSSQADAKPASGPPAVPVLTAAVASKTVPLEVHAFGNVEPYASVTIKSRVDGQIVRVGFRDGEEVAKGQVLFLIDPRPFEAQLREAQANLARDKAQLENARAQENRYRGLLGKHYVSQEQYTQARTGLAAAAATVQADEALVQTAQLQLEFCTIRSPIVGRTGQVMVDAGNLVKANDTGPLVVINQTSPVYVDFAVPEQKLAAVRAALRAGPVTVTARPPQAGAATSRGSLSFVDNAVNTTTGTIRLRASFANRNHALWPGQFVAVVLILREQADAVVVPSTALQTGPKGPFVFVVRTDHTVALRPVVVERSAGEETVIAKGLAPGEIVVTEGQLRLTPGAKVRLVSASNNA